MTEDTPTRPSPENRPPAFEIRAPARQTIPLVFASPHSGDFYPPEFIRSARLDPLHLRGSEDAFMDKLFAAAPAHGAPLICAKYPRAFVDPNREPYELDPDMFVDRLPRQANTTSPRVAGGLGTIARVIANGEEIYRSRLPYAEAERRIENYYKPYHGALNGLLDQTRERFGAYLLIDCHSMPSIGGPMDNDPGLQRVDFVLGDGYGTSCAPAVTQRAEAVLKESGFLVTRNNPYAGGFTTRHYGHPAEGRHTLQIEVNRALYMDERAITPTAGFAALSAKITLLIAALADIDSGTLKAPLAAE
ncbi:MAG: N-formylglutamate amidohydrolase [Rhodospirillales bacterium]